MYSTFSLHMPTTINPFTHYTLSRHPILDFLNEKLGVSPKKNRNVYLNKIANKPKNEEINE